MKKVIVTSPGGADVLKIVETATPTLNPGQVLIQVEAAGVNYVDIYFRSGSVPHTMPFTPGFEGVGKVLKVAADVRSLEVGTRVAWINYNGSYASHIALPAEQAIVIPDSFSKEDGLLFQGVTAQYLVSEYRSIKPGDTVLVHAAAGGVGQILVRWLKHLGAIVIGTASTEEKLETIRALGADHAVNYSNGFLDEVLKITNGRGVDLALDAVGATTFASSVKSLAQRGTAVAYGQASGVATDVQIFPLIMNESRVAGGDIFGYIKDPAEMQVRAAAVIKGISEGWLRMANTTDFELADVAAAHKALESRSTQGKLALVP